MLMYVHQMYIHNKKFKLTIYLVRIYGTQSIIYYILLCLLPNVWGSIISYSLMTLCYKSHQSISLVTKMHLVWVRKRKNYLLFYCGLPAFYSPTCVYGRILICNSIYDTSKRFFSAPILYNTFTLFNWIGLHCNRSFAASFWSTFHPFPGTSQSPVPLSGGIHIFYSGYNVFPFLSVYCNFLPFFNSYHPPPHPSI